MPRRSAPPDNPGAPAKARPSRGGAAARLARGLSAALPLLGLLGGCASGPAGASEEARRRAYAEARPDLAPPLREAILDGRVVVGMTPEQLRAARGAPHHVSEILTAGRRSEQWVYPRGGAWEYVYVEDGRVTRVEAYR
jgi:hypothetical protein